MIRSRKGWGDGTRLASRLVERITLEAAAEVSDEQGGVVRAWSAVASCFAEVVPLYTDAAERLDAERSVTRMQYRISLRSRDDVTTRMRVMWGEKILAIRAVVPVVTHLELLAEEGVAS